MRALPLAAVLACALVPGCGGFSVTPTSPSGTPAVPVTLAFRGTLADGGSFEGSFTYGANDQDERTGFGRYRIGFYEVVVHGGSASTDVRFSNLLGGRAAVETTNTPKPAIGLVFLWPEADPAVQGLTPHVQPRPGYDPDVQPRRADFGTLLAGSIEESFGLFNDGHASPVVVTGIELQ